MRVSVVPPGFLVLLLASVLAAQATDELEPPSVLLRGVIGRAASLEDTRDGTQIVVRKGETVQGWRVVEITAERITLEQGEARFVIPLVPETEAPGTPGSSNPRPPATPTTTDHSARLIGIAGPTAILQIIDGAGNVLPTTVQVNVGTQIDGRTEVAAVNRRSIDVTRDGQVSTLGVGQTLVLHDDRLVPESEAATPEPAPETPPATPEAPPVEPPGDSTQPPAPGEAVPAEPTYAFLGALGTRAVFEVTSAAGTRQVLVELGGDVIPGHSLSIFDATRAVVADPSGATVEVRVQARPRVESTPVAAATGVVPPYPWRVPLWERTLMQALDNTQVTQAIVDFDLDACVGVLNQNFGVPVCLDPDVAEVASDPEFSVTLRAQEATARQLVDEITTGRGLVAEPAFGCMMIGLEANLAPIRERRQRRDAVLAELTRVKAALAELAAARATGREEALAEELRFTRHTFPAKPKRLGAFVAEVAALVGAQASVPQALATLEVTPDSEERSLADHLSTVLAGKAATTFSGNLLLVLSTDELAALAETRRARAARAAELAAELLEFPRTRDLGLTAPASGALWQVIQAINDAGMISITCDEATWARTAPTISLPARAKLGHFLDTLAALEGVTPAMGAQGLTLFSR